MSSFLAFMALFALVRPTTDCRAQATPVPSDIDLAIPSYAAPPKELAVGDTVIVARLKECGDGKILRFTPDGKSAVVEFDGDGHNCRPQPIAREELANPFARKLDLNAVKESATHQSVELGHAVLVMAELGGRAQFSLGDLQSIVSTLATKAPHFPIDLVVALDGRSYAFDALNKRPADGQQKIWEDLGRIVSDEQAATIALDRGLPSALQPELFADSYSNAMTIFDAAIRQFNTRHSSWKRTAFLVSGGPTGTAGDEKGSTLAEGLSSFAATAKIDLHSMATTRKPIAQALLVAAEISGRAKFSVNDLKQTVTAAMTRAPDVPIDLAVALDGTPEKSLADAGTPARAYFVAGFSRRSAEDQAQIWDDLSRIVTGYQAAATAVDEGKATAPVSSGSAYASALQIFDSAILSFSSRYPTLKHTLIMTSGGPAGSGSDAAADTLAQKIKTDTTQANIQVFEKSVARKSQGQALFIFAELAGRSRFSVKDLQITVGAAMRDAQGFPLDLVVALDGTPAHSLSDPSPPRTYSVAGFNLRSPGEQAKIWEDLGAIVSGFQKSYENTDEGPGALSANEAYANALRVAGAELKKFSKRYPTLKHTAIMATGGMSGVDATAQALAQGIQTFAASEHIDLHGTQTSRRSAGQALLVLAELAGRARFSVDDLKALVAQTAEKSSSVPIDLWVVLDANPEHSSSDPGAPPHTYAVAGFSRRSPDVQQKIWAELSRIAAAERAAEQAVDEGKSPPPGVAAPAPAPPISTYASAMQSFEAGIGEFSKRYPVFKHSVIMITGGPSGSGADPAADASLKKIQTLGTQAQMDVHRTQVGRKPMGQALLIFAELSSQSHFTVQDLKNTVTAAQAKASGFPVDLVVAVGSPAQAVVIPGIDKRPSAEQEKIWADLTHRAGPPLPVSVRNSGYASPGAVEVFASELDKFSKRYPSLQQTAIMASGGASPASHKAIASVPKINIQAAPPSVVSGGTGAFLVFGDFTGNAGISLKNVKDAVDQILAKIPGAFVDIVIALPASPGNCLCEHDGVSGAYTVADFEKNDAGMRARIWEDIERAVPRTTPPPQILWSTPPEHRSPLPIFKESLEQFAKRHSEQNRTVFLLVGAPQVFQSAAGSANSDDGALTQPFYVGQSYTPAERGTAKDIVAFANAEKIRIHAYQASRSALTKLETANHGCVWILQNFLLKDVQSLIGEIATRTGGTYSSAAERAPGKNTGPGRIVESSAVTQIPGGLANVAAASDAGNPGWVKLGVDGAHLTAVGAALSAIPEWAGTVAAQIGIGGNPVEQDKAAHARLTAWTQGLLPQVISAEAPSAPLEMGSAKVTAWAEGQLHKTVSVEAASAPLAAGSAELAAWTGQIVPEAIKAEAIATPLSMGSAAVDAWAESLLPTAVSSEAVATPLEAGVAQITTWLGTLSAAELKVETISVKAPGSASVEVKAPSPGGGK